MPEGDVGDNDLTARLVELAEAEKAATPGPWKVVVKSHYVGDYQYEPEVEGIGDDNENIIAEPPSDDYGLNWVSDLSFIALARNLMPSLLSRLQAAEKVVEAAALPRNTRRTGHHNEPALVGEWVAVPREDFDALREALAAWKASG